MVVPALACHAVVTKDRKGTCYDEQWPWLAHVPTYLANLALHLAASSPLASTRLLVATSWSWWAYRVTQSCC